MSEEIILQVSERKTAKNITKNEMLQNSKQEQQQKKTPLET